MSSFKEFLNESGFAHVRRLMMGDLPNINTMGIITANNPHATPTPQEENNRLNRELMNDLRSRNYGPMVIKGKYGGNMEDSFLVPHISRSDLVELGKKYGQEAVIWGKKETNENGVPYIRFHWIEGDKTTQTRSVSIGEHPGVRNRDDAYSQVGSRRFIIPFFADPFRDWKPGSKLGKWQPSAEQPDEVLAKAEFHIPFFDDSDEKHNFFVESDLHFRNLTYFSKEIPPSQEADSIVEEIKDCEEWINGTSKVNKSVWIARGKLVLALERLQAYLDRSRGPKLV